LRDAISRAVNSPDSALLLTNETQLEDTLRSARQTAQVCGVILVLGPKDNNETIDVEPEAPSADSEAEMPQSPFDTREEDGCVALYIEDEPTEPEDYQVPSSRRRPFPQPRPKSLNGSDGGKDETPGASRPEDPTQLEFYRSGSSSDVVDQQCRQSGEYQLQPTEEDEENEALKDRVYRFNFVEDGQDAELPGVNYDENLVLKFRCENCDRKLKAKGETIGKKVRCKGCMKRIRAPKDADDPRVYFSSTDAERGSETGGSSTL